MSTQTAAGYADHGPAAPSESARDLPPAINAESGRLDVMGVGGIGYYRDVTGEGPAVVLIHSINAAASAYEMRPLFESFRGRRRVFALDLPGFGRSQRGDRPYSAAMFAEAIERFIVDVASPQGEAVDAVASSLSSEFLARVAVRAPALFRSLTLLSPTGLGPFRPAGGPASALLRRALHIGPLSEGIFRLLRTQSSIRYFLQKSFVGSVDEGLLRYSTQASAASGGRFAPVKFIAGELFTRDAMAELYEPLKVPTRVVYDQDPYTRFDRLDALSRANANVTAHRVAPTRGLPQFERTADVVSVIEGPAPRAGAVT
ncbi:MAG: putative alpha/beta hydrolase [Myxococcaceae bacterium]|nr:putative alpha/beta hydrolase [Myxococcaceae bacterium]